MLRSIVNAKKYPPTPTIKQCSSPSPKIVIPESHPSGLHDQHSARVWIFLHQTCIVGAEAHRGVGSAHTGLCCERQDENSLVNHLSFVDTNNAASNIRFGEHDASTNLQSRADLRAAQSTVNDSKCI